MFGCCCCVGKVEWKPIKSFRVTKVAEKQMIHDFEDNGGEDSDEPPEPPSPPAKREGKSRSKP